MQCIHLMLERLAYATGMELYHKLSTEVMSFFMAVAVEPPADF